MQHYVWKRHYSFYLGSDRTVCGDRWLRWRFYYYPNPTSGVVNIDGVNGEEISVYTSRGILVERTYGNSIDLSAQPAGVYMLKVGNKISRVVKN